MNNKREPKKSELKRRGIYLLPNLFTTGGLLGGFYAIIAGMNGQFESAAIAIFIAMVMDALDGRVARMTDSSTAFGAEYDSLSDVVSFGVAPACVIYNWVLMSMNQIGWVAAFIYVASAALRLARFNTQIGVQDKRFFQGLPSPAAAAVIAGFVWLMHDVGEPSTALKIFSLCLTISLGFLMVSNVRYSSFKEYDLKDKVSFMTMVSVVLVIVFIAINPPKVLFGLFFIYAVTGPVLTLWHLYQVRLGKRKSDG